MRSSRAVPAANSSTLGPAITPTAGAYAPSSAPAALSESARLHGLEYVDGQIRARLDLDGANHLLRYRLDGIEPDECYEPFVVAATPLAMRHGSPLSVPSALSPRL